MKYMFMLHNIPLGLQSNPSCVDLGFFSCCLGTHIRQNFMISMITRRITFIIQAGFEIIRDS
jgi:hypothetical protein